MTPPSPLPECRDLPVSGGGSGLHSDTGTEAQIALLPLPPLADSPEPGAGEVLILPRRQRPKPCSLPPTLCAPSRAWGLLTKTTAGVQTHPLAVPETRTHQSEQDSGENTRFWPLLCRASDTAALPLLLSAVPVGLVKAQAGQQALCFRSLVADLPLSLRRRLLGSR